MRLTFLGGADEVGASSTLIEMGGKLILVDVGIRISPRTSRGIQNDQLPHLHPITEKGGPDYILVTHAHTDHTGALPLVVEQFPHVPVIATRPTLDLVRVLQSDAQRIMRSRHEAEGELPLFDEVAVERLMDAFQLVEFNQALRLGDGLQVTYTPSGHIAGAASLILESGEGTLVMSGDLSLNDQRAVVSAQNPRVKADALVLESTYGGRAHANRKAEEMRLIETLKRVTERGGKVLIPAFALGRAQEVIQIIHAYRDQFEAPVYVDGMVRAVCNAYHSFQDLLPQSSVRMAKDNHLFFRNNVKPIKNGAHRDEIANSDTPLVVVASSGMLTGGASVAYARAFAGDERNGIFLTGYQDEESPGRFLQKVLRDSEAGKEVTWKLDGKPVTLRCEIGTYSLSAHADEAELVSLAEAYDATDIMLVHGDPSARHSLATRLRQRERRVLLPKIAQTETLNYKSRPWAIGRVETGKQTIELNPRTLWESLKEQAGSYYSAQEIAQMWWGDSERAAEAKNTLEKDGAVYFAADWRNKDTFQVRSSEQVARTQRQRAIMLANPDIVGKLIVMRNSNGQPRLAIVRTASIDGFEADVSGSKGRQFPADALLWVVGDWQGYRRDELKGAKTQMRAMVVDGQAYQDILLPYSKRQEIVDNGKPVIPSDLLPETLPDDIDKQVALVAAIFALARDGATLEQEGLLPRRAKKSEPLEQNEARDIAYGAFPAEARLRKVGIDIHRKRLTLNFDFPDMASREYGDEIEKVMEQTNWDVHIKPGVNQQALGAALDELLPEGAVIVKGPSFFMDRQEVGVDVEGVADTKAFARDFLNLTGYRLKVNEKGDNNAGTGTTVSAAPENGHEQMEINAAYGVIRNALEPFGLYKAGLKQGQIILTFISPQIGERHTEVIQQLAEETGYALTIHPHPNQQQILQVANKLIREAGWNVRKGPGIHVDRGEISVKLINDADDSTVEKLAGELEAETGYKLVVG